MTSQPNIFDRALLARRRARAASTAGEHDFLLRHVSEDIVDRLSLIQRQFPVGLNLGAHTGALSRRLRELGKTGLLIDADPSAAMLAQCDGPRLAADEELLPFGPATLDLVVSGLALQFVNDLPGVLVQIRQALKGDGLFIAALLGAGSLAELREAFLIAETEIYGGATPRVAPFADVRTLGGLLQRAGFALPVADVDSLRVTYAHPLALMAELKAMGASNVLVERSRRPMTRRLLARAAEVYAEKFGTPDGRIPATFEIVTLTAWAPDPSQPKPLRPGSAKTRLADALGVPEGAAPPKKKESP
ncbi:methyltransferase domain-containing protein [Hyphomicrobium sp. CS1BSMeth3]|uniref:methyltransferase domain-containing protein n=1 Tax=Hyphomicrobium sp. CS1BSMeth3 TaxID=1892844 RepID=UPI000930B0A4|nr:methyltransferase domain-containing protein [Hyphomicrobium sp. CS1BSMeth3]